MDNKYKESTGTEQGRVRKGRNRVREKEVMQGAAGLGDGSVSSCVQFSVYRQWDRKNKVKRRRRS